MELTSTAFEEGQTIPRRFTADGENMSPPLEWGEGEDAPDGTLQGKNDFGKIGFLGPSPPPGKPHRYVFTLFALDTKLGEPRSGSTAEQLRKSMKGRVLAEARLAGQFGR